ncbi:Aspartate aminotransferase-like enzyme OS=Streptomyces albaduncus OX=68172 GN=FHS32_003651 PE=3 SV=1 [Streptomyces griseoloalbus]
MARLLGTGQDVVITQGEALLPLEGAIRATAGPGTTALNVITGPYGQTFGDWLREGGATVVDLAVPFHTAVTAAEVGSAAAMLDALAARTAAEHGVDTVETTVAPGNTASERLFTAFAERHGALLEREVLFGTPDFPDGPHDPEVLHRIGPFAL